MKRIGSIGLLLCVSLVGSACAKVERVATEPEFSLQGKWQLVSEGSGSDTGTLDIEGDRFVSSVIHGEYEGEVFLRLDSEPAEIDFVIRECGGCIFLGETAKGIFRSHQDGSFSFAAPAPGVPRPTTFEDLDETQFIIERATRR